jgi:hypothetical protein
MRNAERHSVCGGSGGFEEKIFERTASIFESGCL